MRNQHDVIFNPDGASRIAVVPGVKPTSLRRGKGAGRERIAVKYVHADALHCARSAVLIKRDPAYPVLDPSRIKLYVFCHGYDLSGFSKIPFQESGSFRRCEGTGGQYISVTLRNPGRFHASASTVGFKAYSDGFRLWKCSPLCLKSQIRIYQDEISRLTPVPAGKFAALRLGKFRVGKRILISLIYRHRVHAP